MNLNREQFQIPKEHHDAIRAAIAEHERQGTTFSPTSTDYRDETGKVHRVPVDRTQGRYLAVDPKSPKNSMYTHALPSESINGIHLNTFKGQSDISRGVEMVTGPHAVKHSEPELTGKLRSKQLEVADKVDKQGAAHGPSGMTGVWSRYMNDSEGDQRVFGDQSHTIHVSVGNVEADYDQTDNYEYDTKTGNIGPRRALDLTAAGIAADNPIVNRSEESGFGTPGQHLRSFKRD